LAVIQSLIVLLSVCLSVSSRSCGVVHRRR